MNQYAKWIGGGLGWMYGGPIGAFLGYQLGKYISKGFQSKETSTRKNTPTSGNHLGSPAIPTKSFENIDKEKAILLSSAT